jgi:hypothetical protein
MVADGSYLRPAVVITRATFDTRATVQISPKLEMRTIQGCCTFQPIHSNKYRKVIQERGQLAHEDWTGDPLQDHPRV